jgi:hypothetical protein
MKPLMGVLLLAAAGVVGAQEENPRQGRTNVAAAFEEASGAKASLLGTSGEAGEASGFAVAAPGTEASAEPGGAAAGAAPAAKPRFVFGSRDDYRWQLGVGVEYLRFVSSRYDASLVGLNTTVTYFTNGWFALEGNLVTGFAPTIYANEHVKFFGGAGGIRIGSRRARWEPWAHGLVGGSHLQPQTAGASRGSFMAQAGGGVDYRLQARLSFRLEGDWVYTAYFSQSQNNFQGVAGVVLHF